MLQETRVRCWVVALSNATAHPCRWVYCGEVLYPESTLSNWGVRFSFFNFHSGEQKSWWLRITDLKIWPSVLNKERTFGKLGGEKGRQAWGENSTMLLPSWMRILISFASHHTFPLLFLSFIESFLVWWRIVFPVPPSFFKCDSRHHGLCWRCDVFILEFRTT